MTTKIETRLVRCKPTSPGRRHVVKLEVKGLHKGDPYRPLVEPLKSTGGRNNAGRVSVRYRGGGHKRLYRIIDFKRNKFDIPGKVERFEYDPNRNAHIALILYPDGERRYIIAPKGLEIGQEIISSKNEVPIKVGNATRLRNIPVGTLVHNVELKPGKGGQLARAAGTSVQILGKEGDYAIVRLRSGEMRKIHLDCMATIGEVGNEQYNLIQLGKAGASRWRGRRPHVRGVAMNPVDHPHGGGEGRQKGYKAPVSPWGWHTKGKKTRHNKRTDKWIIKRRK